MIGLALGLVVLVIAAIYALQFRGLWFSMCALIGLAGCIWFIAPVNLLAPLAAWTVVQGFVSRDRNNHHDFSLCLTRHSLVALLRGLFHPSRIAMLVVVLLAIISLESRQFQTPGVRLSSGHEYVEQSGFARVLFESAWPAWLVLWIALPGWWLRRQVNDAHGMQRCR